MPVAFAINGLGRIGRALTRVALARPGLELVAVNELASAEELAHLLLHDTVHGRLDIEVEVRGDTLAIAGRKVRVTHFGQPDDIPWGESAARVVVDATGKCLDRESAGGHLRGSVEKVIVSANAAGLDLTLCRGVNDRAYDPERHHLLSAASCTTNCLAPLVYLLDREFGIAAAAVNTVHSYNNDQRLLEFAHRDRRRARAAALNMIPTTTSAVDAVVRILPELEGKISGLAVRVPTPNVSLVDLVARLEKPASVQRLNDLFCAASTGELGGVLAVSSEELVSSDFLGNPSSAIVDLPLTASIGAGLFRVIAWYDNEWGHSSRLADLIQTVGATL